MTEFSSVSVYNSEHAKLVDLLNARSTEGWSVVSIISTGSEVVAYLSRDTATASAVASATITPTPTPVPASTQNGWASASTTTSTPVTASIASNVSPVANQTVRTPSVPADWYKDPAGRYEFRYWDGNKWTEHVSRAGVRFTDPPTP